eukprot:15364480-Ditylum_brightwellii.AAC.1
MRDVQHKVRDTPPLKTEGECQNFQLGVTPRYNPWDPVGVLTEKEVVLLEDTIFILVVNLSCNVLDICKLVHSLEGTAVAHGALQRGGILGWTQPKVAERDGAKL